MRERTPRGRALYRGLAIAVVSAIVAATAALIAAIAVTTRSSGSGRR